MDNARFALVTGTSSGIGHACARQLLDRGWTVVGIARRAASIAHPRYTHVPIDLAEVRALPAACDAQVAPVLASRVWQRTALVNNAARGDLLTPLDRIDPAGLLAVLAVNTVAPVWLMGFIARHAAAETAVRIVNVSSGAAVTPFPGLAAYCTSKAALRMAGQAFAAELDAASRSIAAPADTAILSYQPGIVDTPMQTAARSADPAEFPSAQLFRDFHARGLLVPPDAPASEIVAFLESDSPPRLTERRLGAP
jgi:NAD(P)-dependent dehydrogenase (short-subunit alcohol dehydrogenase family)